MRVRLVRPKDAQAYWVAAEVRAIVGGAFRLAEIVLLLIILARVS